MSTVSTRCVLFLLSVGTGVASGQSDSTYVDARSNIFGYGASSLLDGDTAISLSLPPGTSGYATFAATGLASWGPGWTANGPDGGEGRDSSILPRGPIAGYVAPRHGHLVGLFIEAGDLSNESPPNTLSYSGSGSLSVDEYSPSLRQVFFIGDGLKETGTGGSQRFLIPDNAVALVLGIADSFDFNGSPGYYFDNSGGFEVGYVIRRNVVCDVPGSSGKFLQARFPGIATALSLTKTGSGSLVLDQANALTGATTVRNGVLQIGHANALSTSTISVLTGATLSLDPGLVTIVGGLKPNAGGLVDIGTGMVTVSKGLSVLNAYAAVVTGRGDGAWDGGSGITSSAAASSNGTRTVGWLDNGDGSLSFAYAAPGDANMDWRIDIVDIANFLSSGKFNSGLTATWAEGDFNYDGFADVTDIADFLATNLYDAGPYNSPAGTIAAVPEPSVMGLFGVGTGVAGLMAMRRKRAA
jgi:autotransporter-associated beta strand protein